MRLVPEIDLLKTLQGSYLGFASSLYVDYACTHFEDPEVEEG